MLFMLKYKISSELLVNDLKASITNIEEFLLGVSINLLPHKDNLESIVNKYLARYNIDSSKLKDDDINKIVKYLNLFVDFV